MNIKNISFLKNKLIAHRGLHYNCIENTIPAFIQAIEKNYIIECDIHLSKDKELVVYHDYTLKRLYNKNILIKDLTHKELKKYKIPSLEEVLSLINGKVPIIIEIKVQNKLLLKKLILLLDKYKGKFAIQSFNPLTILSIKILRPLYVRGYLTYNLNNLTYKTFLNHKLLSKILKPDFIGMNISSIEKEKIQKLRKKYFLIGYTIKNEEEYLKYDSYADNFICDIPAPGIKKQETVPLRTVSQKE